MRFIVHACALFFFPCLLLGAEQVVEVPPVSYNGALFVNAKARKLYAGWGQQEGEYEKGLFVYDIQADGTLTGSDERIYPNSPDPFITDSEHSPTYFLRAVGCMLLSRDEHKLYLGVQGNRHSESKTLVVYDLDDKGEPKGKPRGYPIGNFHLGISHMLLDPKLDLLYTIGWGGSGLFTMPLDKAGEPRGEPQTYGFGYNAKSAMIPSEKYTVLIFGGQTSVLEVGDLTPDGMLQLPVTSVPIPDIKDVVQLARVGRFLYFVDRKKLYCWPLDKEWRPVDNPKAMPGILPISVWEGVHSSLYVVEGEYVPAGKKGDPPKLVSTKIARYKPDDKGNLGKAAYVTETFEKKTVYTMTVDESSGTIYVSLGALP